MTRCTNKVTQYVPRGYGYRAVETTCGSTSIHGDRLQCDACANRAARAYPQGWRNVPGDTCKHGVYVGDQYGPDYMCGQCESE